jgi:hypothetical protein
MCSKSFKPPPSSSPASRGRKEVGVHKERRGDRRSPFRDFDKGTVMRVLITGCGLIGCYTAKELTEHGDEVTFFDLQPNLDYLRKVLGRELPMIRGDIRELPALIEAMQRTRAEVVIHTAGLPGNRTP